MAAFPSNLNRFLKFFHRQTVISAIWYSLRKERICTTKCNIHTVFKTNFILDAICLNLMLLDGVRSDCLERVQEIGFTGILCNM